MDTSRLADLLRSQNFGPNDSAIVSAINHPLTASQKALQWLEDQVRAASNTPNQYDNPNPLAGYTPEQQAGGALNLAGLAQTSAMPFAPQVGKGTLGTVGGINAPTENLNAELLAKYLKKGKLSAKDKAQYEANALAMETPNLQKYNLENANAQGGTPESRAGDLGFQIPSFHGTDVDLSYFDPKLSKDIQGVHSGTISQANYFANKNNGNVYPLVLRHQKTLEDFPDVFLNPKRYYEESAMEINNLFPLQNKNNENNRFYGYDLINIGRKADDERLKEGRGVSAKEAQYFRKLKSMLNKNDFDSIKYENELEGVKSNFLDDNDSFVTLDPKNIRSRFAAFDPLRKSSSSLLASSIPLSLLLNEEYNKGGK